MTPEHPDTTPTRAEAWLDPDGCLYVFAYGSLIWKPGFLPDAVLPALLRGFHRRFCVRSTRYRGTPEQPGLVLGLDRGGACRGAVLRVAGERAAAVLDYLRERELSGGSYHQRRVRVTALGPGGGRSVWAVAFVVDRAAATYCAALDPAEAAAAIARSAGAMGANREYLLNTVSQLRAMGVRDSALERLAALMPPVASTG
ncbi:gamma-glutamylcyclotransferase [Roseomonas sp. BN140053]|uniref:gamma-glutamylcyclotransferase n=1 Tax=Roseomonas sp. BN140053 TaxID=3391898 RepID=UPI0039E89231